MASSTKQFTLRLPKDLYEKSVKLAKRHRISLNELARKGLQRLAEQDSMRLLRAAYDDVGPDTDSDAEKFFPAQREVICGEE